MGNLGFKELLIILAIALLIFGAKRLRSIGSDLGGAVKGFRKSMNDADDEESKKLSQDKDADFESGSSSKSGSKSSSV